MFYGAINMLWRQITLITGALQGENKNKQDYDHNAPVTPNGDHLAIALRSRTLKFCTKAQ